MSEEKKTYSYDASSIQALEGMEHVRMRPSMYIGDVGIRGLHHLVYEVVDNSIDEAMGGYCDTIDVTINEDNSVTTRDNGRGIPVGIHEKEGVSALQVVMTKIGAGGKFDKDSYKVSGGLHGVGVSCVNALSDLLTATIHKEGKVWQQEYSKGKALYPVKTIGESDFTGTIVTFLPDKSIFKQTTEFNYETLATRMRELSYLNKGITITLTDKRNTDDEGNFISEVFYSDEGLPEFIKYLDSTREQLTSKVISMEGEKNGIPVEVAMVYNTSYAENLHSYVNNINTHEGGTHLSGFRRGLTGTLKKYADDSGLLKNVKFEIAGDDFREGLTAIISVKVAEPQFEGQTKTKLGSTEIEPKGTSMRAFINDFLSKYLDNYLHKNPALAEALLKRILQSERERKELSGIKKLARKRAKEVSIHNKKLRDCRVHFNSKDERGQYSTLFITEGDSASGSITKARNVNSQAVFSLKGKPLNSFGLTKKIVYENEEFNLLQAALNIEDGLDDLRYNYVVLATDADVDGMHIRLLLITFFLQFFPDLVKNGHLYVLETPLFRVRNKKETIYCYSEGEKQKALIKLGGKTEITRFKGLGEISPDEFKYFIAKDIRLDAVLIGKDSSINDLLTFYMGKNTPDRQKFIIDNLRVEKDLVE